MKLQCKSNNLFSMLAKMCIAFRIHWMDGAPIGPSNIEGMQKEY